MPDETPNSEIVLYQTEDGSTRIQCRFENETIWLTQALIAELFQTSPQNATMHLRAIYDEGELDQGATCKDYLQVRREGTAQMNNDILAEKLTPNSVIWKFRIAAKTRPYSSRKCS